MPHCFGYRLSACYSLVRDFKTALKTNASEDVFFNTSKKGRRLTSNTLALVSLIGALRKKNFMDRGGALFACLNVLPKAAWLSSDSHRVTRTMNLDFLRTVPTIWTSHHLVGDTANLDCTTIPYWGDATH